MTRFAKNDTVLYSGEAYFIDKYLKDTDEFVLSTLDGKQELTVPAKDLEHAP